MNELADRFATLSPAKRQLLLQRLQARGGAELDAFMAALAARGSDVAYAPPRTQMESLLADIWADTLQLERVGIHDRFFEIGGQSLLAVQVVARVRDLLDVMLPVEVLFTAPTVAELAVAVEAARGHGGSLPPLVPAPRDGPVPLSFSQERLWFLDRLEPESRAYHVPRVLRITGPLDLAALEAAFDAMIERHEILRTTFPFRDGQPVQQINPHQPFRLPVTDLRHLAGDAREAEAARIVDDRNRRLFDLENGPLLRVSLLRLEDEVSIFMWMQHHMLHDGWSQNVFFHDLAAFYTAFARGEPSPLPPLPIQFADYVIWQRNWMQGPVLEAHLAYWRAVLGAEADAPDLPFDRPRRRVMDTAGTIEDVLIPAGKAMALRALCREHGVTLYMMLYAILCVTLLRHSGQTDISIGVGIANRRFRETEGLLGMLINTIVLRTDLTGDPDFLDVLDRVRKVCIDGYAHQDTPFGAVVEAVSPSRSLNRSPLFQVMFNFHDAPIRPLEFPGLEVRDLTPHNHSAKFDINIISVPFAERVTGAVAEAAPGDIAMMWEYRTSLFDAETMRSIIDRYMMLIDAVLADPAVPVQAVPLMTHDERAAAAAAARPAPAPAERGACLHQIFAAQAARRPDAVAISFEGRHLSYAQLDQAANRLANHLRALGAGPETETETIIGLSVERSPETIIGILAILKAGGAYLPLDPAYPADRLAMMVADAGVGLLVTAGTGVGEQLAASAGIARVDLIDDAATIAARPQTAPADHGHPDQLAYVIFTSGSTGRPKGVAVSHRNVTRLFDATAGAVAPGPDDVWTMFHAYAFDFSVWEIWGALAHGGRLVVVPYWVSRTPEAFATLLVREQVTILNQTPSAFHQIAAACLGAGRLPPALRLVIFGGEALDVAALKPWAEAFGLDRPVLANMYGITETTVHVTWHRITAADLGGPARAPVGRPIADLTAQVLDSRMMPVPPGVVGELHIGGAGLARGYIGRPGLTAWRFVPDPAGNGARLYRTGDIARPRRDGGLDYKGRIDDQVKVRGYRIELGEVEAALRDEAGIVAAAATVHGRSGDDRRLIGYVVRKAGGPEPSALRDALRRRLPEHMVPAMIMPVEALPLTASGKLDRRALPVPDATAASDTPYVAPRTATEEILTGLWAELLGLERVGIDDDFFELGGHSLIATRLAGRIREDLGVEIPLRALFEGASVRAIVTRFGSDMTAAGGAMEEGEILFDDDDPTSADIGGAGR
ncbi:amino acid adenylation domain-containing protein [Tistrella sp. BH-R2-4]|uniref:Amino acid adenylation domain-containing protein n=1 Tax=Tistrella arctica TaxID=3133430 RepID=A0ABU9YLS9_9PROT